jgi:biopolymer transport protein ExbD
MRNNVSPHANKLGRTLLALLFAACALWSACVVAAAKPSQRRRSTSARPAQTARPPQTVSSGPLTVEVSAAGDIKLDGRSAGTLRDTAQLTAAVKRIFESREKELARRARAVEGIKLPNDGLRDRSVFVRAPATLGYGAVVKVIDALKTAGALPVGLKIDDEELRTAPPEEGRPVPPQGAAANNETPSLPLPAAIHDPSTNPSIIKESSIVVAVTSGGDIYLNKQKVEKGELESALKALLSGLPDEERIVYLRAEKEVSYSKVVEVINTAKRAGAIYIGLMGEPRKRD